jgi:hypothetical protein
MRLIRTASTSLMIIAIGLAKAVEAGA